MIPLAVVALLAAEVATLVVIAHLIGVLATILLLVAGSLIGGWLLRREGTRAWRAFTLAVTEGRPPGREVLDGMLVLIGGAFVLFPGFVSDVLGLLCLLPPTRRGLAVLLRRYAARRMQARVIQVQARRGPGGYGPGAPGDPVQRHGPAYRSRLDDPGTGPPPSGGRVIEGQIEER